MAFTTPTEDIIVQEGTFAFDYLCSGTVTKGQGVYAIGTMACVAPTTTGVQSVQPGCLGVAAYTQTHGNQVAVYGPGNIVRVSVSGTSTAVNDELVLVEEGKFREAACTNASGVRAIALETQATNNGACRVLLI
jgi:hypothetical protein